MRRNYIFIGQKVIQLVINNPFKAENGTPFFFPPVARAPRRACSQAIAERRKRLEVIV